MLWPTINPDGQQIVAEWYMKNVGTPYELSGVPRLYQEYVGHDNNRDAYMLNMIESRVIEHTWRQWEPQIIYVHHQSGPFPTRIWLPPFSEPVGADAPLSHVARSEHDRHGDRQGARGARPGRRHAHGHRVRRVVSRLHRLRAELQEHRRVLDRDGALPVRDAARLHARRLPRRTCATCARRACIRARGRPGWWRLRDAVDYMETASLAVLEYASKYKDSLLFDRYKAGRDQIARGATRSRRTRMSSRSSSAIPSPRSSCCGGSRSAASASRSSPRRRRSTADTYPAGTWVVPTDQEFAAMAREVLDVQHYPDLRQYPGGPPERPYDAAGWTLPLQMGVASSPPTSPLPDERARQA